MGMQRHVLMHLSLEVAKRNTQRRTPSGLEPWYMQAVPVLSLKRGGGVSKSLFPLIGSLESGQSSMRLRFDQNATYFASAIQGHLNRRDATDQGLIRINDRRYIKICQMTAKQSSERTYLSRISMCIQSTFLLFLSSQQYLNLWTQIPALLWDSRRSVRHPSTSEPESQELACMPWERDSPRSPVNP